MDKPESSIICRLTEMFNRQSIALKKYGPIEEATGLLTYPRYLFANIDNRSDQSLLRDYAWRITEELGEATIELEDQGEITDHFYEELMDALHFMITLMVLSNITPKDILFSCDDPNHLSDVLYQAYCFSSGVKVLTPELFDGTYRDPMITENPCGELGLVKMFSYEVIHYLAKSINCLKNKVWKQTHVLTDSESYRQNLIESFHSMILLFTVVGMDPDMVYEAFILKNKVNAGRINSGY